MSPKERIDDETKTGLPAAQLASKSRSGSRESIARLKEGRCSSPQARLFVRDAGTAPIDFMATNLTIFSAAGTHIIGHG